MGQLGRGSGPDPSMTVKLQVSADGNVEPIGDVPGTNEGPGPVTGVKNAVAIGAGGAHACVVEGDGTVKCWGKNEVGQLGQGAARTRTPSAHAQDRPGCEGEGARGGGALHVRSRRRGHGALLGFAREDGLRREAAGAGLAREGGGLAAAAQVEVGNEHACAVTRGGDVFCWQHPDYQPARVELPGKSKAIAVGWRHACAVGEAGEVWCWGENDLGQLGAADSERQVEYGRPGKVPAEGKAVVISGRGGHVCVIQKP